MTAMGSVYPTIREDVEENFSKHPTVLGSKVKSSAAKTIYDATQLHRDGTMAPKSSASTQLARDGTRAPTIVKSFAPSTSTKLNRDDKTVKPDDSVFNIPSILKTKEDIVMASRQTKYDTMSQAQKTKQDTWVKTKLKDIKPCPDGYEWSRHDGGYMCSKGGHAITDEMWEEGKGAIAAMPEGKRGEWELKEGPYYFIDGGRRYQKRAFKGVATPAKYLNF
jgi:hypothetical protein